MIGHKKNFISPGLHQFDVISNVPFSNSSELQNFKEVILLLHGFCEKGATIYKRLGDKINQLLNNNHQDVLILAPNGLYPILKEHPFGPASGHNKKAENLLRGYSWYFYHQSSDSFLIDYKVPAETLGHWINNILPSELPVTIVGYSQGGYLAPFVGLELKNPKKIIGVNCSFREEMLPKVPYFPMYLIQGREDRVIDTELSYLRFEKIKERGLREGEFIWVPDQDHKLTKEISQVVLETLGTY